jgi:LPS-assembly protein
MFLRTVIESVGRLLRLTVRGFARVSLPLVASTLLSGVVLAQSEPTQVAQVDQQQSAQSSTQRKRPTLMQKAAEGRSKSDSRMLVQADELVNDFQHDKISAVGHVQIYNDGAVLEADQVVYDRKTNRIHAQGNVRYKSKDGKVIYGDVLELNKDFRDGFANSFTLETPQKTRFSAARADRTEGDTTIFQSGVYTACEACKDDSSKPPLWQIKARRIIHKEGERTVYYQDASFEFFGQPIAYFPVFWHPDPTVKRQTGYLIPHFFSDSRLGIGAVIPYFWALAPDKDLTFALAPLSKQGILAKMEWRQRFQTGSYTVKASGIFQQDKSEFDLSPGVPGPGSNNFRGAIETSGQFSINKRWVWGWDGTLATDRTYLNDYGPTLVDARLTEKVSQLYLVGQGDRSYFDLRAIGFMGMSETDRNNELPIIHPVLDYSYILGQPVFGGELGFTVNFTSLSRQEAQFTATNEAASTTNLCDSRSIVLGTSPKNCLLQGAPGEYTRASYQMDWKRTITNSIGQVFTPFVRLRADAAYTNINNEGGVVSNFINTGGETVTRFMPAIGFEARWPFLAVHEWGTQILEPIAQMIVRPNETQIGRFPNEDAQSLVFSDANLFAIDKYSGFDRVEGGSRLNAGIQYSMNINRFGTINALFGQSYNLFGKNSFANTDATNTGLQSGLETDVSDYVARLYFQPSANLVFITRYLLDKDNFSMHRFEAEAKTVWDRLTMSTIYARYEAQPLIGFLTRREGVYETANYKFEKNWSINGGVRYDLQSDKFDLYTVGLSYLDECIGLMASYTADYTNLSSTRPDHRFVLRLVLRNLSSPDIASGITTPGPVTGASVVSTPN